MIKITIQIDSKDKSIYTELIDQLAKHVVDAKESDPNSTYSSITGSFNPKK